jgi:hypothetical protein
MSFEQTSTYPLLEQPPKAGAALLVQDTMQAVIENPSVTDEAFYELWAGLGDTSIRDSISARYNQSKRYHQAAVASTAFMIGTAALPDMLDRLNSDEPLTALSARDIQTITTSRNTNQLGGADEIAATILHTAQSGAFWLTRAADETLSSWADASHPFNRLYQHLVFATNMHVAVFREWKKGPGQNRWPEESDEEAKEDPIDAAARLKKSLRLNVSLGIQAAAAKAVHHLIHYNPDASQSELDQAMVQAVPRFGWYATADRHVGWRPDWMAARQRNEHIGVVPSDGVEALLQRPTANITRPNGYAASASGLQLVRDPDFCPHNSLRNGPITKAASCGGEPWASPPTAEGRYQAHSFFNQLGFRLNEQASFNMASLTLAMGAHLVSRVVLPRYFEHRAAEKR